MSSADDQKHNLASIFLTKSSYHHFACSFHPYHKHDINAFIHVLTTGLGVWGAIQLVIACLDEAIAFWMILSYATIIAATTPLVTAVFHTVFVHGCLQVSIVDVVEQYIPLESIPGGAPGACAITIAVGYGLQDLIHWLCAEATLMSSYIHTKPSTLFVHTIWLMPLVIDSVLIRHLYVPKIFVSRNRNFFCQVTSKKAIEEVRQWINREVPETPVS